MAARSVFHQAYGSRKLAGEQGLDGSPAPAEPMTEDTIFDIASLTKPLATATAVMQLYEQGKVALEEPVQSYLPDFNAANDPERHGSPFVMLLTHTSGEPIDVDLARPVGSGPSRQGRGHSPRAHHAAAVGARRGLPLRRHQLHPAGRTESKSSLAKQKTNTPEQNIFAPLGMTETRYLPPASLLPRIAPTAIDDESSCGSGQESRHFWSSASGHRP